MFRIDFGTEARKSINKNVNSKWFRVARFALYITMSIWVFLIGLSLYITSAIISMSYTNVLMEPNKVRVAEMSSDGFITQDEREMSLSDVDVYVSTAPGSDIYYIHDTDRVLAIPIKWYDLLVLAVPFYVLLTFMCLFSQHIVVKEKGKSRCVVALYILLFIESTLVTAQYSALYKGYGTSYYILVVSVLTLYNAMQLFLLLRDIRNS